MLIVSDTFSGVVKASAKDFYYRGGEHADTSVELVTNLVKQFISKDQIIISKGIFPEDNGDQFASKTFNLPNSC